MTTPQSPTKASARANNPAGDGGDLPHAYVENGQLFIMEGGRYVEANQIHAWNEWFTAAGSPYASTQERARQIRAAMDEAYPQDIAA